MKNIEKIQKKLDKALQPKDKDTWDKFVKKMKKKGWSIA
jgi:uncharacterized protein YpiB (UPF0302 family)